jgi:hypothetical protein
MCTTGKRDFDPSPKKKAALESSPQEQRHLRGASLEAEFVDLKAEV